MTPIINPWLFYLANVFSSFLGVLMAVIILSAIVGCGSFMKKASK